MKQSKTIIVIFVAILLLIVLLAILPKRKEVVTDEPTPPPPVTTMLVQPAQINDVLHLPARVQAVFDAALALDKAGIVAELPVDRGSEIEAGQILLRLEDSIWKAGLEAAEIQHREAKREWNRWQELRKTGAVSTSEFDAVQARFDLAKVTLENARINLEKCVLRSPSPGVIADRYVEIGEHVAEGAPAFRLVNAEQIKLTVDIPERDVLQVHAGMAMPFTIDSLPGHVFTGTVTFVAAAARAENNSFPAELMVENTDGSLRPGMMGRLALSRGQRTDAIVLPFGAVIPKRGEYVAFVVEDGKALQRLVKLDYFSDFDVVLSSGLEPGEEVVIEGNRALTDGMTVKAARTSSPTE